MRAMLRACCAVGVVVAALTACGGDPASEPPSSGGITLEEQCARAIDIVDVVAQTDGADVVVTWRDGQQPIGPHEYWIASRTPGASGWEVVGTVELEPDVERRHVVPAAAGTLPAEYTVALVGSCVRTSADICSSDAPCPVAGVEPVPDPRLGPSAQDACARASHRQIRPGDLPSTTVAGSARRSTVGVATSRPRSAQRGDPHAPGSCDRPVPPSRARARGAAGASSRTPREVRHRRSASPAPAPAPLAPVARQPVTSGAMTDKVDLRKSLDSYRAQRGRFRILDVPDLRYLMVDGHGDPNTSPAFTAAVEALYPVAYAIKFASKRELGRDYVVPPLEGLWWADDMDAFTAARDKSRWDWTLMLLVPDWIGRRASIAAAMTASVRLETLSEGRCVQTLHVGSFDDEGRRAGAAAPRVPPRARPAPGGDAPRDLPQRRAADRARRGGARSCGSRSRSSSANEKHLSRIVSRLPPGKRSPTVEKPVSRSDRNADSERRPALQ